MSEVYNNLVKEYKTYQREKHQLTQQRQIIEARLSIVEDVLIALDNILCKSGEHIYEHFEERSEE